MNELLTPEQIAAQKFWEEKRENDERLREEEYREENKRKTLTNETFERGIEKLIVAFATNQPSGSSGVQRADKVGAARLSIRLPTEARAALDKACASLSMTQAQVIVELLKKLA